MSATINQMLAAQSRLQQDHFQDPATLTPEERAQFLQWNFTAMVVEMGEAFAEVGWKPWATDRSMDKDKFIAEMVDAWHFFMNMLLATGIPVDDLGDKFSEAYFAKNRRNAERQIEGYTGKNKCTNCHRELDGIVPMQSAESGSLFCTMGCYRTYFGQGK